MQGAMGASQKGPQQGNANRGKSGGNDKVTPKDGDYIDYEEVK